MNVVSIFLFSVFNIFASANCGQEDSLLTGTTVYQCNTLENGKLCVKFGQRDSGQEAMRVFSIGQDRKKFDKVINDDPVWHRCNLSTGLDACTHEEIKVNKDEVYGYIYRSPNLFHSNSWDFEIEINRASGQGLLRRRVWDKEGELHTVETVELSSCE